VSEAGDQELSDTIGHQRGWEVVTEGIVEEYIRTSISSPSPPIWRATPSKLATRRRSAARTKTHSGHRPHFNALLAHEIIGHPTELDRALKMETAYAGRSWLLRALNDTMVARRWASALVTAYSDRHCGLRPLQIRHEGRSAGSRAIEKGIFKVS